MDDYEKRRKEELPTGIAAKEFERLAKADPTFLPTIKKRAAEARSGDVELLDWRDIAQSSRQEQENSDE
jgi:hypothetical protein